MQRLIRSKSFFRLTISIQRRTLHLHRDSDEELFNFTTGRWLRNHEEQRAVRYLPFDVNVLAAVASEASGSTCVSFKKMHESLYSRVFLLKTENGRELIVKTPFPIFGPPDLTIASEVATMDFIRTETQCSVPVVLAWSSNKSNKVGTPYIIYEKMTGTTLSDLWDNNEDKDNITNSNSNSNSSSNLVSVTIQCMQLQAHLTHRSFSQIGSIFYKEDISPELQDRPLYDISVTPATPNSDRFRIGPSIHPALYRGGRSKLDIDRGPWENMQDYARALSNCERMWILNAPDKVKDPDEQLKTLSDFNTLIPYLYPDDNIGYCLSHRDLHAKNVLIDTSGPKWKVTWLDWQGASVHPIFDVLDVPPMFEYSTTSPLVQYDTNKPFEKPVYAEEYHNDSVAGEDKVLAQKAYREAFRHWMFMKTHKEGGSGWLKVKDSCKMYNLSKELLYTIPSGSTEGPEAPRWSMIKAVWNWDSLPCVPVDDDGGKASIPCPVQYPLEEQDIWEQRLVEAFRVNMLETVYTRQLGLPEDKDGLVFGTEEEFREKKEVADKLYQELIDFARSEEERMWYVTNWPFRDGKLSLNALSCT